MNKFLNATIAIFKSKFFKKLTAISIILQNIDEILQAIIISLDKNSSADLKIKSIRKAVSLTISVFTAFISKNCKDRAIREILYLSSTLAGYIYSLNGGNFILAFSLNLIVNKNG